MMNLNIYKVYILVCESINISLCIVWLYTVLQTAFAKSLFIACVLVSAGIELIFFLVAGIVLCFGFSMRIMLIAH